MLERIPIDPYLIIYWTGLIIRGALQGTLVLGFVWMILLLFPKIHPTLRSWLWRIVYLKFLISFFEIPPFRIWLYTRKSLAVPLDQLLHPAFYFPWVPTTQFLISNPVNPIVNLFIFNRWKFCFMIAVLGMAFGGIRLVFLWHRNRRLWKDKYPVNQPVLEKLYREFCAQLKIAKPPRLFLSESINSPLLQGLIHPRIILPAAISAQYQPEEIKLMLAHELAHFKRRDLWWNWLPMIVHVIYFFDPLVWLAEREWKESQEICCDHLAVQFTGARRVEYGKVLVKVACWPATVYQARESWFNLSTPLRYEGVQFYTPKTKKILKKRLIALDSSNCADKKRLVAMFVMVAVFGFVTIFPWKIYPVIDFRLGANLGLKPAPALACDLRYDSNYLKLSGMSLRRIPPDKAVT